MIGVKIVDKKKSPVETGLYIQGENTDVIALMAAESPRQ